MRLPPLLMVPTLGLVLVCGASTALAQNCPSHAPRHCSNNGGYCCDEAHPYCTNDGRCSDSMTSCPSSAPLHCSNNGGYCCPERAPYCTSDGNCSESSGSGGGSSGGGSSGGGSSGGGGGCQSGQVRCNDRCMPAGADCCGNGRYCDPGSTCTGNGRCSSGSEGGRSGGGDNGGGGETDVQCSGAANVASECSSVESCCGLANGNPTCWYIADGKRFSCSGSNCSSAAQRVVDYCSGGSSGSSGSSDPFDDGGCATAASSSTPTPLVWLTLMLLGFALRRRQTRPAISRG